MTFEVKVVDEIGQREKKELEKSILRPELMLNDFKPCLSPPQLSLKFFLERSVISKLPFCISVGFLLSLKNPDSQFGCIYWVEKNAKWDQSSTVEVPDHKKLDGFA